MRQMVPHRLAAVFKSAHNDYSNNITVVCHSYCNGSLMVLLWQTVAIPRAFAYTNGMAMVSNWYSNCIPKVFHWNSKRIPFVFQWQPKRIPMVFQEYSNGFPMEFQCCSMLLLTLLCVHTLYRTEPNGVSINRSIDCRFDPINRLID